jgi:hypothetical protein
MRRGPTLGAPSHGPAFGGIQTIQVLHDAADNPIQVHGNIEGTFFANGITLREIERGQIFIDLVEGTETDVGLVFRVFLPGGGTAIADVGRLVFDAEGNAIFEAGPPPGPAWRLPRPLRRTQLSSGLSAESMTPRLPARRATRVPYRRVNHGIERATTVTSI